MAVTAAQRLIVDGGGVKQRLDRFLAAHQAWGSRAQVQRLIVAGRVRVDGQVAKPSTMVHRGQEVVVEPGALPTAPAVVEAEAIPLRILYEDEWLLVIDKPAGLVVHPAPGHWRGTLVGALLHHWQGVRPGLDPTRPGIVHRLDKDTSGVLVVAKDARTLEHLAAQFRGREVRKQYVAAVWGRIEQRTGVIDAPIGRNPVHRRRMAVRPTGRAAHTRYEVLERGARVSVVRLVPTTGRTHQLRVHLAAIGHPIVGDREYAPGRTREAHEWIGRQALHAERLAFRHPHSGGMVAFTAPLPADMAELCRRVALRA